MARTIKTFPDENRQNYKWNRIRIRSVRKAKR